MVKYRNSSEENMFKNSRELLLSRQNEPLMHSVRFAISPRDVTEITLYGILKVIKMKTTL